MNWTNLRPWHKSLFFAFALVIIFTIPIAVENKISVCESLNFGGPNKPICHTQFLSILLLPGIIPVFLISSLGTISILSIFIYFSANTLVYFLLSHSVYKLSKKIPPIYNPFKLIGGYIGLSIFTLFIIFFAEGSSLFESVVFASLGFCIGWLINVLKIKYSRK